jgi:hypothetical protein
MIVLFPLCFLGFDFTDLTYHITNQIQASQLGLKHLLFNPLWAGSDIIGGLWIKIVSEKLWAIRLFLVFLYGLSFTVLAQGFKKSHYLPLLIIILFSASPMPAGMIFIADYYTLPTFAIFTWSILWFKLYERPDSLWLLIGLGVVSTICIFIRVPLLVISALPAGFFLYQKKFKLLLKWICLSLLGLGILYISGIIEGIYEGLKHQSFYLQKTSGLHTFLGPFFRHLKENLFFLLQIALLIFAGHKISKRSYLECALYIFTLIFLLAILDALNLLSEISFLKGIAHSSFKRGLNCLHLLMCFAIAVGIYRDRTKLYLLPIALMPWILNFGTNTGISKMNYLLPCSFFCLVMLYELKISKGFLATFLMLAIAWNYKNFYRDGHLLEMTAVNSSIQNLEGIITSGTTVKRIAWLESVIQRYELRHQNIVNYPALPGINYLNQSSLYLGFPWSLFIKEDIFQAAVGKDCKSGTLKAAFIDQDSKDSQGLLKFINDNCPVHSRENHGPILFLSFQS